MSHKALILPTRFGNWEVGDVQTERPGKGEILVKVHAAALNPIDWKVQKFYDDFVESYPLILGQDAAGTVEEVGEGVTNFKKGDRVFHAGHFKVRNGTFQQYVIVLAEIAAKIPDNLTFEEAASIPLGLATAAAGFYQPRGDGIGLTAPWDEGGEGKYKGQGILIFGGSSSVGQYTIQFAKLSGFSPIVATASLHNADHLKSLGATHVIDRKADVVAEAKRIASFNVVYDAVSSADTQEQAWEALAPSGSLIVVLPPPDSLKAKNGQDGKTFVHIYGNVFVQRPLGVSMYAHLTKFVAERKIVPNKIEVLPNGLQGIVAGLERMENNKVSGVKLIAKPQEV